MATSLCYNALCYEDMRFYRQSAGQTAMGLR